MYLSTGLSPYQPINLSIHLRLYQSIQQAVVSLSLYNRSTTHLSIDLSIYDQPINLTIKKKKKPQPIYVPTIYLSIFVSVSLYQ